VRLRSAIERPKAWAVVVSTALLLIAVTIALALFSFGSHEGGAASGDRTAYTKKLDHDASIPGASTLPEILAAVVARYGGHLVVSAEPGVARGPQPRKGAWLHFVVAAPAQDERVARPEWEADLVEGAVADALEAATGNSVADSRIDLKLPDGTIVEDASGGMGEIAPGQDFTTGSDLTIKDHLRAELTRRGLTPVSIDVLHADQPAPAVVATTTDARRAARDANETIGSLFGTSPPTYEGYYLEIRDVNGTPVLIESAAFRSGSGRLWVRPDLEDVASVVH
jgi:hypothetical protein